MLQFIVQIVKFTLALAHASCDLISLLEIEAIVFARFFEQIQRAEDLCVGFECAVDARVKALVGIAVFIKSPTDFKAERYDADDSRGGVCHCGVCYELGKSDERVVEVDVGCVRAAGERRGSC
jgi:hypothetical protein